MKKPGYAERSGLDSVGWWYKNSWFLHQETIDRYPEHERHQRQ